MANLIIEISPEEPRASLYTINGGSPMESEWSAAIGDCTGSGDAESACCYVLDEIGVEFRIVAGNPAGKYEWRLATDAEKTATAEAIYFDSASDFADQRTVELYLVWDAANNEV